MILEKVIKRLIAVIIILAISLACLASCNGKTPIGRSKVGNYWNSLINEDQNVQCVLNGLFSTSPVPSSTAIMPSFDREVIDKSVALLREFESHIEKEIKIDDTSSEEYRNDWAISSYGSIDWKMISEAKDTEREIFITITFSKDMCRITVFDINGEKASSHFKCDVDTLELCRFLNAIFEQETNAE